MSGRGAGLAEAAVAAPETSLAERLEDLPARYSGAGTEALMAAMITVEFPGRIALISSFGAEAAVLLALAAGIDPALPVIFLDTGKLFGETLSYRDALIRRLRLRDVRSIWPDPERIAALDADGVLWYGNPEMCCYLRKVEPLERALAGFDASITGRKAFHGGERAALPRIEVTDTGHVKVNPLADWSKADIEAFFERHDLPRHPLEADGFLSIGCMPCTDRVRPGEEMRSGRWRGRDKTECGIHRPKGRWKMIGID